MYLTNKERLYLKQYINPLYLTKDFLDWVIKKIYSKKSVKFLNMDDFLQEDFLSKVMLDVYELDTIHYSTQKTFIKMGSGFFLKWEYVNELNKFFYSTEFEHFINFFTKNKVLLEKKKSIEFSLERRLFKWMNVQCYEKWHYLDWHTDWPIPQTQATIVFYLNPGWLSWMWGEIELGEYKKWNIIWYKNFLPIENRFIIIITEEGKSFHRIKKIQWDASRHSFHDQLLLSKKRGLSFK